MPARMAWRILGGHPSLQAHTGELKRRDTVVVVCSQYNLTYAFDGRFFFFEEGSGPYIQDTQYKLQASPPKKREETKRTRKFAQSTLSKLKEKQSDPKPAPKKPRLRRRRRTSIRRGRSTATCCRWPQEPSAASQRNLNAMNAHGHSTTSLAPPIFQPTRRRLGQPPPAPNCLQPLLPTPPRPARADTPKKKTTSTISTKNGSPPTTSFSPRRHGRPEKQGRSSPDEPPPQPPQRRRWNGERRGRTKPYTQTPPPPSSETPWAPTPRSPRTNYTHGQSRGSPPPRGAETATGGGGEQQIRRRELWSPESPPFRPWDTVAGKRSVKP
jgi:hypothetical protein